MFNFFGKKTVKEEGVGEELHTFLEKRGFKQPIRPDTVTQQFAGEDGQLEGFEEGKHQWKYSIVRPIINVTIKADEYGRDMDRERHEQIVLDPYLTHYIHHYSRVGYHTPGGNPIRQSPQAFILETSKGHSSLIVTCKNRVFGIGLIMSDDEYPEFEDISKTYLDILGEFAAKSLCDVDPLKEEHVVIATSPDAAFNIFDTRRSKSTKTLYASCKIKATIDFTSEYADNLLNFLNQTGHRRSEAKWIATQDSDHRMINSVEILTNILYKAVNPTLGLSPEYTSLNCANLMEIIFSGQISAGYGVAHPSTVHSHSGPVTATTLASYYSDSQDESQPMGFGLRKHTRQKKSKRTTRRKKSKRTTRRKKTRQKKNKKIKELEENELP